jgi:hypothetical protein
MHPRHLPIPRHTRLPSQRSGLAMFDSIGTVPNVFFQAIVKKETWIGKFWFEVNDGMPNVCLLWRVAV